MKREVGFAVAKKALLLSAVLFTQPALGETPMKTQTPLQSAAITVSEGALNLKADYSPLPPDETARQGAETLLRNWGELKQEQSIYYAAAEHQGHYTLSLLTDPGKWQASAYPAVNITRESTKSGGHGTFTLSFAEAPGPEIKSRLIEALAALIRIETGEEKNLSKIETLNEINTAFRVSFK